LKAQKKSLVCKVLGKIMDDNNYLIVLPPGIVPIAGDHVRLSNLNTDIPLLEIGARKLVGQHQRLIGTTGLFSKPTITTASSSSSGIATESISSRSEGYFEGLIGGKRIVFKLADDQIQTDQDQGEKSIESSHHVFETPQTSGKSVGRGRGRGNGRGSSSGRGKQ